MFGALMPASVDVPPQESTVIHMSNLTTIGTIILTFPLVLKQQRTTNGHQLTLTSLLTGLAIGIINCAKLRRVISNISIRCERIGRTGRTE